jgi:site-specific DNA recombinase
MATKRLDGYIRVSRRGGRTDDRFLSPQIQREKIEAWAANQDVEIADWWEEIDQSGGTLDRPKLRLALERCRTNESDGIVVADRSRFARTLLAGLQVIQELEDLGKTFAAADGFDSSTPEGRLAVHIMLSFADFELQRIRENWRRAITGAVARGIHVTGFTPSGYLRDKERRFVPDPVAAKVIAEAFRMRARGDSFQSISDFLATRKVRPSTGNELWSRQGVRAMLQNRVYLGEARGPHGALNVLAHKAIVTTDEFAAAQVVTTASHPRDGSIASQAMLVGLIKCANCGHNLAITGTGPRDKRVAVYYCRKNFATGKCARPAVARAAGIDTFVVTQLLETVEARVPAIQALAERVQAAEDVLAAAEAELDAYLSSGVAEVVGQDRFLKVAREYQEKLDAARGRASSLPALSADPLEIEHDGELTFFTDWGAVPMALQREHIRQFVAEVRLHKSGAVGRLAPPYAKRVEIDWVA